METILSGDWYVSSEWQGMATEMMENYEDVQNDVASGDLAVLGKEAFVDKENLSRCHDSEFATAYSVGCRRGMVSFHGCRWRRLNAYIPQERFERRGRGFHRG